MTELPVECDEDVSSEETLLKCARHGQLDIIQSILKSCKEGRKCIDINCKGSLKSNRGWTPLHLATYFGHEGAVKLLLEFDANVNVVNNEGDTALHKAVLTDRLNVVTLLLQNKADVTIINAEGKTPKMLSRNDEISRQLEAAAAHDAARLQEEFLSSVREGNMDKIVNMLSSDKYTQIDFCDSFGNNALHVAAQCEQKAIAVYLLQRGFSTTIKNKQGLIPADFAKTETMRQLLNVKPKIDSVKKPLRFEGLLIKRRFVGYVPLWVVLERGVLSYFKCRGDASTGAKRRSMKYLDNAVIMISEDNIYDFLVKFSDGTAHKLSIDPGASNLRIGRVPATGEIITRQIWVNALKDHIDYNTHYIHSGNSKESQTTKHASFSTIQESLQRAQAYQDILAHRVEQASNALIQSSDNSITLGSLAKVKEQLEETVSYAKDMCSALNECHRIFCHEEEKREKELLEEKENNRVLQEALHALAVEHHELQRTCTSYSSNLRSRSYSLEDDEFFDCDEDDADPDFHHPVSPDAISVMSEAQSFLSVQLDFACMDPEQEVVRTDNTTSYAHVPIYGRTHLPVPMFDRNDFSIWTILKQCIGKELSKITMPVVFNEPLTFLQRITEYLEYSYLLDTASRQDDPADRIMYVAAFAVSAISCNWGRIGKPFNPLLGETYELDRPDLGFRLVAEQVCHHPPVSAFHMESKTFKFHGSVHPKLKFWGKSVEINPKGVITLELLKHGETYTWQNVNCCVHNVIVGKIWIEHVGVMEIYNHKTKHKVMLNFKQGGWFCKDLHKVEGFVYDENKCKVKALYGSWVMDMFGVNYDKYEEHMKVKPHISPKNSVSENGNQGSDIEDNQSSYHFSTFNLNVPGQITLWRTSPRPHDSEKYFSFTSFAMSLNELKDNMTLPPTDSRLRPDVRILEEGNIDMAGEEKNRLEEKQREARQDRKKRKEEFMPLWFSLAVNPVTENEDWIMTGKYWERDWSKCPNIF